MFGLTPHPHLILLLLLVVVELFSCSSVQSLRFELQSGLARCIAEDIKSNSMTVGNYTITNPNEGHPLPDSHTITVRVVSPRSNLHHFGEHVQSGHFAFVAEEAGDYMACFWGPDLNPQVTLTIDFDWKTGVEAKGWGNIAKKSHIDRMALELQILHETVSSIHEEMFYMRAREEEMQQLNWTTNTRMFWLSFLSFFVCFSVAGLQLWHLKTFFEKKKLI